MDTPEIAKPSYDEWMYWTQVIVDRLTTVTHVYGNPPHPDVFMPEREKQEKLSSVVDLMGRLHRLTDNGELGMPKNPEEAAVYELEIIEGLQPLYKEVLERLPLISMDMQKLLKSPWFDNCAGKLANILFRGTYESDREGIGSGRSENGRLPSVIEELLDRESTGTSRMPRIDKPRHANALMRREDLAKLWGRQNSAHMRTAGRMN